MNEEGGRFFLYFATPRYSCPSRADTSKCFDGQTSLSQRPMAMSFKRLDSYADAIPALFLFYAFFSIGFSFFTFFFFFFFFFFVYFDRPARSCADNTPSHLLQRQRTDVLDDGLCGDASKMSGGPTSRPAPIDGGQIQPSMKGGSACACLVRGPKPQINRAAFFEPLSRPASDMRARIMPGGRVQKLAPTDAGTPQTQTPPPQAQCAHTHAPIRPTRPAESQPRPHENDSVEPRSPVHGDPTEGWGVWGGV